MSVFGLNFLMCVTGSMSRCCGEADKLLNKNHTKFLSFWVGLPKSPRYEAKPLGVNSFRGMA